MINFLKGLAGGIGAVVPGLSGSVIFVILNIYEGCINSIYELIHLKNIKKNILFLLPILIGIVLGILLFGRIIKYLLDKFPLPTSAAFLGFILGTIPFIFKEADKKGFHKKYYITFFISFFLGLMLTIMETKADFTQLSNTNLFQKLELGFVLASGDIIPGISSTVLLTIFGMYDIYLKALAEINILFFVPVILGFALGAIFFVVLMKYLLKNFYGFTYYAIVGFVIATVPAMLRGKMGFDLLTLLSVLIAIFSFFITYMLGKLE